MEYDNNRPFSSEGAAQERKRKHALGKGVIIGVVATLLVVILALSCVFMGLIRSGNLHIGIDGRIYVQDVGTSDNEGIGTKVESKLNALDSLLGDGFYFDDVDDEKAADNIFKAYLAAYGDKYTVYYTPEEYKSMMESTSGSFYGIGAVCQKADDGSILISEAYEDAPAYKAGIRNGDKVTEVNGEDITGMDLSVAVALIKGEKGTDVNLTVMRNGEKLSFTVTRDKIDIKTVSSEVIENNIGYIYISQFDDVTTEQFKTAVDDLQKQGITGLVIDIRNNPGGVLNNLEFDTTAFGFVAGFTGKQICDMVSEYGINTDFIQVDNGFSRINMKIKNIDGTEINGMGPQISEDNLHSLVSKIDRLSSGDVLVLAGSIPSCISDDIYRRIMGRLQGRDVKIIVDATSRLLLNVLEYHPFLIKPNQHELGDIFGVKLESKEEVIPYARKLQDMGAVNVLISMGGKGAVLIDEYGKVYEADAPKGELKNSVGAGDSMVAGFMAGYLQTCNYEDAFRMGVATGSASAFSENLATKREILEVLKRVEVTCKG